MAEKKYLQKKYNNIIAIIKTEKEFDIHRQNPVDSGKGDPVYHTMCKGFGLSLKKPYSE
jgi:hypothetical protein